MFPDVDRLLERYEGAAIAYRRADGFVPRTALKAVAFRGEEVTADQLDILESELVRQGRFERREARFSGRHGASVAQFRATSVVVPAPTLAYVELVATLALSDRLTLMEFAHDQAECEAAKGQPGVWTRISVALQAGERAHMNTERAAVLDAERFDGGPS